MTDKTIALFDMSVTADSPAGSCILQMLKGLCQEYQFTVFADRFDNPDPHLIQWVRVPLPRKPVFLRYIAFKWLAPFYYRQYVKSQGQPQLVISTEGQFSNCDICYAHFCHQAYLESHPVQANLPRKVARLITRHFNAKIEAIALNQAQTIVVPSEGLANELARTYGTRVQNKLIKVSNPVDVSQFTKPNSFDSISWRNKAGFSADDIIVVFSALGDFDRKGLKPLIEAIATVNHPQLKLLVIGGVLTEIREYQTICDRHSLSDRVHFTGFQLDIRPYLWSANLFALPSNYETFSLVSFQAAVAGLPILATQLYGIEEFLTDRVNGWLVERQVSSIVNALEIAIHDRAKIPEMGKLAHEAVSHYDQSIFVERWREVLQKQMPQNPLSATLIVV